MFDFLKPKVPQITVDDVKTSLAAKENVVLLDVRTPQEYQKGRIRKDKGFSLSFCFFIK